MTSKYDATLVSTPKAYADVLSEQIGFGACTCSSSLLTESVGSGMIHDMGRVSVVFNERTPRPLIFATMSMSESIITNLFFHSPSYNSSTN